MFVLSAVATSLQLFASPLLTRLYPPEAHGVVAPFLSAANIVTIMISLRLDVAIGIEKYQRSLIYLFRTVLWIAIGSFLLTAAGALLLSTRGMITLDTAWLSLLCVAIAGFRALQFVVTRLAIRLERLHTLANNRMGQKSLWASVSIACGFIGLSPSGLMLGPLIGEAFSLAMLPKLPRMFLIGMRASRGGKGDYKKVLKKHINYPLYSTPHAFLTALGNEAPTLILAATFPDKLIGFFALAMRISLVPVTFFTRATSEILFDQLSQQHRKNLPLLPVIMRYFRLGLPVTLVVFSGIGVLVFLLFGIIFGADWDPAKYYTLYLLPLAGSSFFFGPLANVANVYNKQLNFFVRELVYFFVRLVAIGYGVYAEDIGLAIILFTVSAVAYNTYNGIWYVALAKDEDKKLEA